MESITSQSCPLPPTYSVVDGMHLVSLCAYLMGLLEFWAHGHHHCYVFMEGYGIADTHLTNIFFTHAHAPPLLQISQSKHKFKGEIKKVKKVTAEHWTEVPDLCEYQRLCNYTDATPLKWALEHISFCASTFIKQQVCVRKVNDRWTLCHPSSLWGGIWVITISTFPTEELLAQLLRWCLKLQENI